MNKLAPDGNMQKVLAELEQHPAVFERAQKVYLARIAERDSYDDIGTRFGIGKTTAYYYVKAYQKIAEKYTEMPQVADTLTFCYSELTRLCAKRKETTTARDFKDLTGEIRKYQEMANELAGLTRKGSTEININYITNIVNVITERLPAILDQHLPKETVSVVLNQLADQLSPEPKPLPS